jgi:Fur family ferric uptake transcriptional regulator
MPNKKEDIQPTPAELLANYLVEHQLRHTPERYTILAKICELQRFTIDELRSKLTDITISRATVYNTLSLLEDARLIQKLDKEFGVRTTQYELVHASDSSVQVICQRCGRVSTVRDTTISRMLADKKWSNFVPHHFSLYVFGHCKVCRRKIKR